MWEQFQKFSKSSGLQANLEKSEIYFSGVNDNQAIELSTMLGIPIGVLPFRYLGVPLLSKKLNYV